MLSPIFSVALLLTVVLSQSQEIRDGQQVKDLVAQYPYYQTTLNYSNTRQLLSRLPAELKQLFHIHELIIYKHKLYQTGSQQFPRNVWINLERLVRETAIPDVYLVFVDRDEMPVKFINEYAQRQNLSEQQKQQIFRIFDEVPMFLASKDMSNRLEKTNFLLPDKYIIDLKRFQNTLDSVKEGIRMYPWESRANKAFWRGQPTGARGYTHSEAEIMQDIPNLFTRAQLVHLSKQNPDLLDARFVVDFEAETQILKKLNWTDYRSSSVKIKDHIAYKYQVNVDGYTATWERIPWILHSGCVLFKQKSPIVQWFYDALTPGVHYVDVAHDLSDLPDKLRYYKEHDQEARAIGQRGKEYAEKYLTHEALVRTYKDILDEFAKVQQFKLTCKQEEILNLDSNLNLFALLGSSEQETEELYSKSLMRYKIEYILLGVGVGFIVFCGFWLSLLQRNSGGESLTVKEAMEEKQLVTVCESSDSV